MRWIARLAFVGLVLYAALPLCAAAEVSFYVAPDGNDSGAGTLQRPFRTPARARDAVRKYKRDRGGRLRAPVTVYFRGGNYFLKEPLVLTPDDGGAAQFPITYAAHKDEKPVLSGGRAVTGWAKKQFNGREVWAATVQSAAPLRSLWLNGRRAVRARHPNSGYLKVDAVPEAVGEWNKGVGSFRFEGQDLKAWPGVTNAAEVVVMSRWVESRLPVKKVDEAERIVSFGKNSVFVIEKGDRYRIEGVAAHLDEPGEWFFDRTASTLYYLPRPAEDMTKAEVVVPVLSEVLRLEGKADAGKTIDHVTFRGIGFSHADWGQGWPGADASSSGFTQAAIGVPAAVHADGARHCAFEACTFTNVGTYGLVLARGCQHNRVTACTFTDLGAGGVKIGETEMRDSQPDQTFANELSDCRITDGGNLFPSAVGVWIGQSYDNKLSHNEIADFHYTGISVGWTWGYGKSLAKGNVIEHNHVHHIGRRSDMAEPVLSDMGGIYTLGVQPGTVIRNNRFHDIQGIKYGGWGIYFDEGSTSIVAENNVVYRTTHGGFHQHYGKDNIFRNNILAFGKVRQVERSRSEPHQSFTFERNIVYWSTGESVVGNWDNCNVAFDRNVYWRADGEKDFRLAYMTQEQWRGKGMDVNSLIADPGFVDVAKDDFNLKPDSPALRLGFVPFDQSDVGPRSR
jgi:hypothetical protein